MNPYKTTYGEDYKEKLFSTNKCQSYKPSETSKDLKDSSRKMLILQCTTPISPPEECVDDYINNTFKEKYCNLANRYFKEPLDKKVIEDYMKNGKLTVYEADYCKRWEEAKPIEVEIPNISSYANIPATTHLSHYRPPRTLTETAYDKILPIKQSVGLGFEMNLPDEARAKMGISEYEGKYGSLGAMLLDYNIHGNTCTET